MNSFVRFNEWRVGEDERDFHRHKFQIAHMMHIGILSLSKDMRAASKLLRDRKAEGVSLHNS